LNAPAAIREIVVGAPSYSPPNERGPALRSLDFDDYIGSFEIADYIAEPIIQGGMVYALTAPTGHGKTSVATSLALAFAGDRNLGAVEIRRASTLWCSVEKMTTTIRRET
jgi:hypothetical protein